MRHLRTPILTIALLLAGTAGPALAAKALVWATGNSSGQTAGVAAYILDAHCFDVVEFTNDDLVPLSTLQNYDAVLYFSNSSGSQNPVAVGDVLADYSDTGRRLVVATFSWAEQGSNTLGGRLITSQIAPLLSDGSSLYTPVTLGPNDASTYFTNVVAISGYYHDNVRLATGAVLRGSWSDGEPLLADKGNVVAVNLFPDDSWSFVSGDYKALFQNAMCRPMDPVAVQTATWGGVKALYR